MHEKTILCGSVSKKALKWPHTSLRVGSNRMIQKRIASIVCNPSSKVFYTDPMKGYSSSHRTGMKSS